MRFSKFDRFVESIIGESFDPYEWMERLDRMKFRMVDSFLKNPKGKWSLIRVPADKLQRIWMEFGKYDRITDLNGLDQIAEALLDGVASLEVANQLQGHHNNGMGYHEMFDEVMEWDEEETNAKINEVDLYEWLNCVGKDGDSFLSDYGPDRIMRLVPRISDEENPRDRLMAIDQALNVIHQRSDLSEFFISGGQATLTRIANQGGYTSDT